MRTTDSANLTGDAYRDTLTDDLWSQLTCAWEEWAEQHAEADADRPPAMKATEGVYFNADEIVVIGKDRSIHHFRFHLERMK